MRLKIWINSFIPRDVPGYTKEISRGLHKGETAVPLPALARLNPLNLFKDRDTGYLTDQRGFSTSVSASRRMQSLIEIMLTSTPLVVNTSHTTSGTTAVDMDTGAQLGHGSADMSRCSFSPLIMHQQATGIRRGTHLYHVPFGGYFTVNHPISAPPPLPVYQTRLVAAAGDPLVSGAADIDYGGVFELFLDPARPLKCTITFEGKIDAFPAYECYASFNGVVKTLFLSPPPPGNTVTDLLGGANRSVRGTASF